MPPKKGKGGGGGAGGGKQDKRKGSKGMYIFFVLALTLLEYLRGTEL